MPAADDVLAVRISGLSRADAYDLRERVSDARLEETPVPPGHMGDPVTFAIVVAIAAGLKGYVAHLVFRDRAQQRPHERIEHKLEIMTRDGSQVTETWSYEVGPGEASEDAIIRGLAEVPGLSKALAAGTE